LNAIVVSALKNLGNNAIIDSTYSTYGTIVDISAPGTDVWSAAISDTDSPCESLISKNGTSMASPQVAAAVALLRLNPEFKEYTGEQMENKLYELAVDLGAPGKDTYYGNGMVNLKYFESVNTATLSFKEDGVLVSEYVEYKNVDDMELEVICSDSDFKIVYTTDGSMPTFSNGIEYTGAIKVDKLMRLQFIGYKVVDGQIVERTNLYTLSYAHKNATVEDYFDITPDGVITNYIGDILGVKELVVPETIRGIVPREISINLFTYSNIERITLPETITIIWTEAFKSCKNLKYVDAPGVEELKNSAFINCESIKFISDYPEANATEGCYLPSLKMLKGFEFNSCINLESVYLPKLEAITLDRRGSADEIIHFVDCKKLTSIDLPALTSIPAEAFVACTELTDVRLSSLTTLPAGLFDTCTKLTSVYLPALTTIPANIFDTCTKLTSVYLPALTTIPANIFEKCTELTGEFFIGDNLHTIEPYALAGTKFTSFAIAPNNKTFYTDGLGVYSKSALVAFAFGVTDIDYEIKTEVEIDGVKHNVTIVGEGAMRECIMNAVTIPENILEVHKRAFSKATINVVYYNVVNCPSSTYYDGKAVSPVFVNVDTFVIGKKVEHIPSHFFKHSSYNFRNLVINSKATTFDVWSLCFQKGLQNLIFNFEDEIDKEYLDGLDAAHLFYSTSGPIKYITSKSEMPMDQNTKFSAYSNMTRVGDYYVYSKESFEGKHRVEATFDKGGIVTPSGLSYYEEGASATFNVNLAVGYKVEAILVDGVLLSEEETAQAIENGYTFSNITGNHTLHASFVAIEGLKIDIIQGVNGSIYRSGGFVSEGESATYTITPNIGYHIKHLIIDGEIIEASSEYTFENISENHTISAVFEANTDTEYKVRHWQQALSAEGAVEVDGKYYILVETDKLAGTTDTETNVVAKDYVGFTAL
ncbi:MAG: leucine-rich repeat protein, partial [Clostridia bacterium]|nr:leucine-rich repeat protein [Clostridia bacterium]